MDDEDVLTMIEDCENRESELTEWETGFIEALYNWVSNGLSVTQPQLDKLD